MMTVLVGVLYAICIAIGLLALLITGVIALYLWTLIRVFREAAREGERAV